MTITAAILIYLTVGLFLFFSHFDDIAKQVTQKGIHTVLATCLALVVWVVCWPPVLVYASAKK